MIVADHIEILTEESNFRLFHMNYLPDSHGDELRYQVVEDVRYKYNFSDAQTVIRRVQIERINEFKTYRDEMIGRCQKAFEDLEDLHTVCETEYQSSVAVVHC